MVDIVFETTRFNLTEPQEGRFGQDVLDWLSPKVELHGAQSGRKYPQSWGWEMEVRHGGTTYLVGASGTGRENAASPNEGIWRVTVTKRRSILERALGKNRMSKTDPLLWMIESALNAEADISNVRREVSAA
ncbi:MAG: hypothetical protein ROO76_16185 [Terriglobia bacterium]|jgi:hypothetical protein|nr:hypothetical protein [Terriglobia bacterium]